MSGSGGEARSTQESTGLRDQLVVLQERLAASEAAFIGIVQRGTDGVLVVDPEGVVRFANPAALAMLGRRSSELLGSQVGFAVVSGLVAEVELVRPGGDVVVAEMRVVDTEWEGRPCLLALLRDITERHHAEAELAQRATHDHLTGLPNRFLLEDRLEQALDRLSRRPGSVALLVADLDDFKCVNDRWGHPTGDAVLVEAGRRIRSVLRPTDSVARFGGDEFVVLCESMDEQGATELVDRLRAAFRKPITAGGHTCPVGLSVGYVLADRPGQTAESLVAAADTAMYRHKRRRAKGPEGAVPRPRRTADPSGVVYRFTLYVAGCDARSEAARTDVERLGEHLDGGFEVTVVDVLEDLAAADAAHILVTPTLVRTQPQPVLRVVGDLSSTRQIVETLGLRAALHA